MVCLLLQKVPPVSPGQQSLQRLLFTQGISGRSQDGTKTCLLGLRGGMHNGAETFTQPKPTATARLLSWVYVRTAGDVGVRQDLHNSSTRLTCKMHHVELFGTGNKPPWLWKRSTDQERTFVIVNLVHRHTANRPSPAHRNGTFLLLKLQRYSKLSFTDNPLISSLPEFMACFLPICHGQSKCLMAREMVNKMERTILAINQDNLRG